MELYVALTDCAVSATIGEPRAHNPAIALFAGLYWTIRPADGITPATILEPARPDETVSAPAIHMVERGDLWHAIVDAAVR
jgi:hypothetical protein